MSILATIHQQAANQKLRFLVIGGLAVNHYGYSRETGDLDLLVSQPDRASWLKFLSGLGYGVHNDGGNFVQFSQPEHSAWPVELMVVQEKTFVPILDGSQDASFYGIKTRVPSLHHLLALKLHALKNTRFHRFLKDFLDMQNLIEINRLDVKSENIRELFLKYGTLVYMKKYPEHSPTNDMLQDAPRAGILEFPVEPDFVSRPPKIELQAMLQRIEENLPFRNQRPGETERRLAEKIPVEFIL